MRNPCSKCQSFGQCSGTCWVLNVARQSDAIETDVETEEYKLWEEHTIPKINLLRMNRTDQEMYWAEKAIGEIF